MSRRPFGVSFLGWLTLLQSAPSALGLVVALVFSGFVVVADAAPLLPLLAFWAVGCFIFGVLPWAVLFWVRARWVPYALPFWWGFLATLSILSRAHMAISLASLALFLLGSAYLLLSDESASWFRRRA